MGLLEPLFGLLSLLLRGVVGWKHAGESKPRIHIKGVERRHSRHPGMPIYLTAAPKDRYPAITGRIEVTVSCKGSVAHLEDLRFELRRRRWRIPRSRTIAEFRADDVPDVWCVEGFKRSSFFIGALEPDARVRFGETLFLNAIARDHRSILRSNAIALRVQDPG